MSGERVIWVNNLTCISLPRLFARSSLVQTIIHEGMHNLQGDNFYRAADIFGEKEAQKIWQRQNGLIQRYYPERADGL